MESRQNILNKIIHSLLFVATIYHLYLVIHPFTPWSSYHISIFSITQVERATHVFFLGLLGFLITFEKKHGKFSIGGVIFLILSIFPLIEFFKMDIGLKYKIYAFIFWFFSIVTCYFSKKI